MQKRLFIIHGWGGYPEDAWMPWLKTELEAREYQVIVPSLPDSDEPRINNWIPKIQEVVGIPDEQTFFVGHSMGCQAIARYLSTLPEGTVVGGAVFVAGFFKRLTGITDDPIERSVEREWLDTPLDLKKVQSHMKKSIALFSDDDQFVPLDNQEEFANLLGSKIIIERNMGHFDRSRKIFELPIVLDSILELQ